MLTFYLAYFLLISVRVEVARGASSDSFYFTVSPTDQDVEEGQSIRLRCAVTPSKDIYYSWLQNGSHIQLERENGRRFLEVESNLQILHADRELDQGTYQCQALNKSSTFTTASKEAKVNVYWMDPDVQIHLLKPANYDDITLGKEVILKCDIKAYPPLTPVNIKWYHNGISRLPNVEINHDGSLRIAEFGTQHIGTYHCRGIHAAGRVESRPPFIIFLDESKPPKPITSIKSDHFLKYVLRGQSLELTCPQPSDPSDDSMPAPSITIWSGLEHLGDSFRHLSQLHGVESKQAGSSIVLNNFDVQHATYYRCETSRIGDQHKDVFIFQVEMAALYPPKRSDFAPRLNKNQPYVVRIGHDAQLRYYKDRTPSVSYYSDQLSNPTPHVEWHKRGERNAIPSWSPDSASSRDLGEPRVYALRGQHLILHQAAESDSGTYEIVLTNVVGRTELAFDLMVTAPPEFYVQPASIEHSFDEGKGISLKCGVKRRSIPGSLIYWEKDGNLVKKYAANNLLTLENDGEVLRFPKLKPEDQGKYQCFVQTDGYPNRAEGSVQKLAVKSDLQFLHLATDPFLEVNVQGRIPCRARGHGEVSIDWFRKVANELQPIQPPNQVESGTLIIQYVQKHDAGQYVCVAHSNYRNRRVNMTINVVVGKKAQILSISPNQTIRMSNQFTLNCRATGDPPPQVSWIVKKGGFKAPGLYSPIDPNELLPQLGVADHRQQSGILLNDDPLNAVDSNVGDQLSSSSSTYQLIDHPRASALDAANSLESMIVNNGGEAGGSHRRVVAYSNGSLVVNEARLTDQAEYICLAGNKHGLKLQQGVFVRVLTPDDFERYQLGEDGLQSGGGSNPGMVKTIAIVVGCSLTYLAFIIGVTVFCSVRMLKSRRNRVRKSAHKLRDANGQLLTNIPSDANNPNQPHASSNHHTPSNHNSFSPPHLTTSPNTTIVTPFDDPCSTAYRQHHHGNNNNTLHAQQQQPLLASNHHHQQVTGDYPDVDCLLQQQQQQQHAPHWWPQPEGGDTSEDLDTGASANGGAYFGRPLPNGPPQHLVTSAPPPTPLDSRSHFSGLSSGNSTSLYSRSLLSGASNNNAQNGPATPTTTNMLAASVAGRGDGGSPPRGPPNSLRSINQVDRMSYPRSELDVEGLIGKSDFGEVFSARARFLPDSDMQTLILVKSLSSNDPIHIDEFHRQLDIFGKLDHPSFTRLLGACMEHEPLYMLLEYGELGTLHQFLHRFRDESHGARLSTVQQVGMCRQIASGMDYLSRQLGLVHRDLATRNIVLTSNELDIKISILSLTRDVDSSQYYQVPDSDCRVALRWLAPELVSDLAKCSNSSNRHHHHYRRSTNPLKAYTTGSDVWAFGVTVWEIFAPTNCLPLANLSDHDVLLAGQQLAASGSSSSAAPPSSNSAVLRHELPPDAPSRLSSLVQRCWSPWLHQRPSFAEFVRLLHEI